MNSLKKYINLLPALSLLLLLPLQGIAGGKETATIWSAVQVLEEILDESSEESIPTSLLRNGDGVVILPGMLSVGWGIGLSHGTGIMLFRKNKIWKIGRASCRERV